MSSRNNIIDIAERWYRQRQESVDKMLRIHKMLLGLNWPDDSLAWPSGKLKYLDITYTTKERMMWATLVSLVPIAVDFAIGVAKDIQEGKLDKEAALARLEALVDGSPERRAKLQEILNSPELQEAYDRFNSALGPDPEA